MDENLNNLIRKWLFWEYGKWFSDEIWEKRSVMVGGCGHYFVCLPDGKVYHINLRPENLKR